MRDDVYSEMFRIEDAHWWYVSKQEIVLDLLRRYLPAPANGERPRVADLGCGCGAMLNRMKDRYDAVGVDGSPHAIEFSAKRGIRVDLGSLPDGISLPKSSYDAVLLLDVLEHLQDDVA